MKISAISTRVQQPLTSNLNNKSQIPFGFSEDYYNDDFTAMNDYVYKESSESVFSYLKLIGEFFVELFKYEFCEPDDSHIVYENNNKPSLLDDEDLLDDDKTLEENETNQEENTTSHSLDYRDFEFDEDF